MRPYIRQSSTRRTKKGKSKDILTYGALKELVALVACHFELPELKHPREREILHLNRQHRTRASCKC